MIRFSQRSEPTFENRAGTDLDQKTAQRNVGAAAALLLLSLTALMLAIGDDSDDADLIGEPLDEARKEEFRGTGLEFIAETGRIFYNERGGGQIIWDPPELPTLAESIRMYKEAVAKNDDGLLPLCTRSFSNYWKMYKDTWISDDPPFNLCRAIPSGIHFGPPSEPSRRSSDNNRSG